MTIVVPIVRPPPPASLSQSPGHASAPSWVETDTVHFPPNPSAPYCSGRRGLQRPV
jgi:hypothetical protein